MERMVMHIDDELERALRAEDPGAAFTQRVLARAREERARASATASDAARPNASSGAASGGTRGLRVDRVDADLDARLDAPSSAKLPATTWRFGRGARRAIAAVAASLMLTAAGIQWHRYQQYRAEGERARAQVLAALKLTSEKLNQVRDAITESTEAH